MNDEVALFLLEAIVGRKRLVKTYKDVFASFEDVDRQYAEQMEALADDAFEYLIRKLSADIAAATAEQSQTDQDSHETSAGCC